MRRIALGLTDLLDDFAGEHDAETWTEFAKEDLSNWKYYFLEVMNDPNAEVFFNLKGVKVWEGLTRAASGRDGATDWELLQIHQNPQWWPRIRWIEDQAAKPNPFE